MVLGNDRTLAADKLAGAGMAHLAPGYPEPDDLPAREDDEVGVVLDRFQQAIDQEIAERLNGVDALEDRLVRVRTASGGTDRALDLDHDNPPVVYAHTLVTLWMRLVLAAGSPIGLPARVLDEIATETVARAVGTAGAAATPSDEPARTVAFLARCADHLPAAYQGWRLRAGVLNAEEVQESATMGMSFLSVLRQLMKDAQSVRSLMGAWGHAEQDIELTIAHTRQALHADGERA